MNNKRPDIIEMLEAEKGYHAEQIERIDIALKALRGEKTELVGLPTPKPVHWAARINEVFKEFDGLLLKDVRNKLAQKGIPQALDKKYTPTIYSTLKRKQKRGELEKRGKRYYKIQPSKDVLGFGVAS